MSEVEDSGKRSIEFNKLDAANCYVIDGKSIRNLIRASIDRDHTWYYGSKLESRMSRIEEDIRGIYWLFLMLSHYGTLDPEKIEDHSTRKEQEIRLDLFKTATLARIGVDRRK